MYVKCLTEVIINWHLTGFQLLKTSKNVNIHTWTS